MTKAARSADRTLVWFRGKDLRLYDHAPLQAALASDEVLLLFVLDPYFFAPARARELPHRMQFLLDSLSELSAAIESRGSELIVVAGKSHEVVPALAKQLEVSRVVAQRWTEPFARERDRRVQQGLRVPFDLFDGETMAPPEALRSGGGTPFLVFTPFARAFRRAQLALEPLGAPSTLPPPPAAAKAIERTPIPKLAELGIERNEALQHGGEDRARTRLREFVEGAAAQYDRQRDRMDLPGTSRLSADLKFGTLSARTVWSELAAGLAGSAAHALDVYTNELIWREFTHALLWDRPSLLAQPFRAAFTGFPFRADEEAFEAWWRGRTGYPVVDAAARQLLQEGFVHNRARMIAASFLTKHLLVDYKRGEAHYMKYLTDGDWAQNNAGWQWSAGCGCDAQPYFRVFNPQLQGEKFDPNGDYVRRYVPELSGLGPRYIHQPWRAPAAELARANVELGDTYPRPIVDHALARERFLKVAASYLGRQGAGSTAAPRT